MSLEPVGDIRASAAGSYLAQSLGSETEKSKAAAIRQRQLTLEQQPTAEIAAADGQNLRPGEREADGRQPWAMAVTPRAQSDDGQASPASTGPLQDRDAARGSLLDVTG